jgi:hypothetical protein
MADIATEGSGSGNIVGEISQTDDVPVTKISDDNGKAFVPLFTLEANGCVSTGEAKPLL